MAEPGRSRAFSSRRCRRRRSTSASMPATRSSASTAARRMNSPGPASSPSRSLQPDFDPGSDRDVRRAVAGRAGLDRDQEGRRPVGEDRQARRRHAAGLPQHGLRVCRLRFGDRQHGAGGAAGGGGRTPWKAPTTRSRWCACGRAARTTSSSSSTASTTSSGRIDGLKPGSEGYNAAANDRAYETVSGQQQDQGAGLRRVPRAEDRRDRRRRHRRHEDQERRRDLLGLRQRQREEPRREGRPPLELRPQHLGLGRAATRAATTTSTTSSSRSTSPAPTGRGGWCRRMLAIVRRPVRRLQKRHALAAIPVRFRALGDDAS